MGLGVIADRIAAGDDLSGAGVEVVLLHADLEERCRGVRPLQDPDDVGRVRTGPIIERERDLAMLSPGDLHVRRVGQRPVDRPVLGDLLGCRERTRAATRKRPNPPEVCAGSSGHFARHRGTTARSRPDDDPGDQRDGGQHTERGDTPAAVLHGRRKPTVGAAMTRPARSRTALRE